MILKSDQKAFNKLDKQVLENLLKPENKTKLVDLLNHHVVAGKVDFKDLKDGEKLKLISGKELHVHVKEGAVSIDGAKIEGHDVQTSNGVIYSLETVMIKTIGWYTLFTAVAIMRLLDQKKVKMTDKIYLSNPGSISMKLSFL